MRKYEHETQDREVNETDVVYILDSDGKEAVKVEAIEDAVDN